MLRSEFLPDLAQFTVGLTVNVDPSIILAGNEKELEAWRAQVTAEIHRTFKRPERWIPHLEAKIKELRDEASQILAHPV